MANNDKENKIKKFTKEAIGKTLNGFNKEIGMADLVEINKNQDRILNGILSQVNDENTEKTEKSNVIMLDNSTDGIVELKEIQGDTNVNVSKIEEMPITHVIEDKEGNAISLDDITEGAINIDNIQGNTMVNCNKEADKELILMEDLSTEGYSNITLNKGVDGGKVDVALEGNTMVNVCDQKEPVALPYNKDLTYLYANTQYTVQFTSDKAVTVDITLGGTKLLAQSIIVGLNKITITTPETLVDNKLVIDGVGAKISEVVVTDTDREFGYFEGMKSVGECEDLEVVSSNSDGTLSNTQTLTHEPLRAVGDTKDKYVLIDGKWYIERNCAEVVFDGTSDEDWFIDTGYSQDNYSRFKIAVNNLYNKNTDINTICYNLKSATNKNWNLVEEHVDNDATRIAINILNSKLSSADVNGFKLWLSNNPITIVYKLASPTYELIDYNPFTVYSDTTHISNNSTIPCNMIIKNTGYNCLLKPSTTYTVSSNLGLNTVTTPAKLTEDYLRFYDTDTSNVTIMKDVMVLEGDYTTGKPLPSHFSGIESAFEQEYDEEVGKYKVKIRVQNEDASKENYIEFYISKPLRGIGDVKDRVYVKDDKVVVERNCGSVIFDGSKNWEHSYEGNYDNETMIFARRQTGIITTSGVNKVVCDKFPYTANAVQRVNYEMVQSLGFTNYGYIDIRIHKSKLQTQDVAGFKQWLQQNPTTVVYQLAEPTYEEVEYSSNRLILNTFNNESFNNSTLFLDTNVSPKLSFKPLYEELVYVKNSTKYYIQFNAVGSGEVVINLGGTELTTEIVEGYNCIPITTPSESTNLMTISGQGITISEVVVSEVICGGYYKGLQSCFEEHMENGKYRVLLRGIALDGSKVNGIKLYINEPLRGIEDVKDRLCIKNGKLMVERKCGEVVFDGSDDEKWTLRNHTQGIAQGLPCDRYALDGDAFKDGKEIGDYYSGALCDKLKVIKGEDSQNKDIVGIVVNGGTGNWRLMITTKLDSKPKFISWLQQNPLTVVYQLAEPTYEEATNEYGLPIVFEGYENGIVYIDSAVTPTTHIKYTSNNQLATTLAEAEEQNITTQEDINMNVITYMMDIDMMLTDMEMSNDISVMAVRRDSSNENMLDRMSDEDKKVYRDNTVVMLEKMITANVLDKEDIEGRIDMYYNKNRISKEQYKYLKSLL